MKVIKKTKISTNDKFYDLSIPVTHNYVLANGTVVHNTGVGYSVQFHHIEQLPTLKRPFRNKGRKKRYLVGDSIEGWSDAIKVLVESYFYGKQEIDFDFRDIRPKGARLITSGGKAPGPEPLRICIAEIQSILENAIAERGEGTQLKPIEAHDIQCFLADAVLAGGIRRAAMISGFDSKDYEMIECKMGNWWEQNPQRGRANNSVIFHRGSTGKEQFDSFWKRVTDSGSGEPGVYWTDDDSMNSFSNPCCLVGTTNLLTENGYKPIESLVNIKDLKLLNKNGEVVEGKVWNTGKKETVILYVGDKDSYTKIECTPDHKFMTNTGESIEAKDLEGFELMQYEKDRSVCSYVFAVKRGSIKEVFDFSLNDDTHWGVAEGMIVHNCEIGLSPWSFCNLTEINASAIESQEDLNVYAKVASFLGTLQAGYTDFHYLRPIWRETAEKEALLGVSITGIASGTADDLDLTQASEIVKKENERVAGLIGINVAQRTTCVKPSGTSSITLGTSSGIHAWHNDYYIRRVRVGKNEAIYTYLNTFHPELLEDEVFRPETQAVISIPQAAPKNAVTRHESVFELLQRVRKWNLEWVKPGHREGVNSHNVSCTISVKEDEWEDVGEWMWNNRYDYNGIAVLPYDGGTYQQAPFQDIDKETYEELVKNLNGIDLRFVIEEDDNTDLKGEIACGGGACEIT